MPGTFTGSRIALTLRRLRGRFGIAAPQVAVRAKVPWYLRALAIAGIVFVSVALAEWAYDSGRRIAGFNQSEMGQVVSELRAQNASLDEEVNRLRSLLTASESNLQIERAAQQQLSEKSAALAQENAKLREDIAVFERLAKLDGRGGQEVILERVGVRADGAKGRYRFGFLISLQGARWGKESLFSLQIVASQRNSSTGAKIIFPGPNQTDRSQYEIALRNFRRIEGNFEVPADFVVGAVEIRIYEGGALKASQNVTL